MSDPPPEPRWDLLPQDPEQFFGLSGDFDLRDLKRSYNRFIRRFKPEKYPAEFQRIRAAYESLNDTLRYDLPNRMTRPQDVPTDWLDSEDQPPEDASSPVSFFQPLGQSPTEPPRGTIPEPLTQRVASTSPTELYQELKCNVAKTLDDYVALALLADLVADVDSPNESFVNWILAGISDHPDDWGLIRLLREFLSDHVELAEIPPLLLRAVECLPSDRFQYTTERAWDRLLRESSFDQFSDCLHQCGTKLGRSIDRSQLVFFVHVLKRALWKADDSFIDEFQTTIEDNFHDLDDWAQEEYEMICSLLDYKEHREAFVQQGPCCQRIDRAIRDWSLLEETEGDLSVLDCQYYLSMRGRRILDDFPHPAEDFSHVMIPWEIIVDDVQDRLSEPVSEDDSTQANHARDFMIRVKRRHDRTFRYHQGVLIATAAAAMALITLTTAGAFAVRMCGKIFGQGQILNGLWDGLIIVAALLGGSAVSLGTLWIGLRLITMRYSPMRNELIQLIRVTSLQVDQLATIIEEQEGEKIGAFDSIDDTDVIADGLRQDAGLEFFSLAQICMTSAAPSSIWEATLIETATEDPEEV